MIQKINVGFVGCGGIAVHHFKGLAKNPNADLVSFCDIKASQAEMAAKKFGTKDAKFFTDIKIMFETVQLDAVYFCLPPYAHGAELDAIKHNVPFFVEKPVNLHIDKAEEISAAIKSKNLLTSVGYMNRYRRGVKKARILFKEDTPILVLGGWIGRTPPSTEKGLMSWWIRKEKSGGQFHEQVTHTVDLTRFLCSEITEVHAFSAKGLNNVAPKNYNIEDASVVNLKFKNGAVGSLWSSCSSNGGGRGVSLNIYGNQTTALFKGWEHSLDLLQADTEIEEIPGEPNIFSIEDAAFIEAVRENDKKKILCTYSDAVKTLEITLAANQSMETGKPVKIHT